MCPSSNTHTAQLAARRISKSYGGLIVLDEVSMRLTPGSRIGLLGPNGVGKSTLLRILAGLDRPDSGIVERVPPGLTIGLLDQEATADPEETVRGFLARRAGIARAHTALDEARAAMSDDVESIQSYTDALDRFDRLGGHDFEARAASIAAELDLDDLDDACANLSGGQRARAALAAIELARFDVLLLDEPTNDLDAEALVRLEAFVRGFPGGIVVVSHDRAFLDASARRFVELDPFTHRAGAFTGSWSDFVAERELRRQQQQEAHDAAVAERARLQRKAHEMRREAATAERRVRGPGERDKFVRFAKISGVQEHAAGAARLERKLQRIDVPDAPRSRWSLHMDLAPATRGSELVARLAGAVVALGSFRLGPIDLEVARGDRIAVTGPNGSGKSSLLRAIAGELPLATGYRILGPSVVPGVLDQDRAPFFEGEDLLAAMARTTGVRGADARSLLAKFELGADDVTSLWPSCRRASGRERSSRCSPPAGRTCSCSTSPRTTSTSTRSRSWSGLSRATPARS